MKDGKIIDAEVKDVTNEKETEMKESKLDKLKAFGKRNWKKGAFIVGVVAGVATCAIIDSKIHGADDAIAALPIGDSDDSESDVVSEPETEE